MAGRTPQQALDNHIQLLQQAISCFCNGVLLSSGVRDPSGAHMLRLAPNPQRLHAPGFLALTYLCDYALVETDQPAARWRIRGLSYRVELHDAEHEILAYHWHPIARGDVVFPHLHLSAGARVGNDNLTTAHLPTGVVLLEDVLRLVMDAFGVEPMRPDWDQVLATSRAASEEAWQ